MITQPTPKEGTRNVLLHSSWSPNLDRLLNKAFRAPSFGGGCLIPITMPYKERLALLRDIFFPFYPSFKKKVKIQVKIIKEAIPFVPAVSLSFLFQMNPNTSLKVYHQNGLSCKTFIKSSHNFPWLSVPFRTFLTQNSEQVFSHQNKVENEK